MPTMEERMQTHDQLRQRNRKRRVALSSNQLERAAAALAVRIESLPEFELASRIAAYFAVNGEISLAPVIDRALAAGKRVYLPGLERQSLRFSPYFHDQKMRINRFRLPEPDVAEDEMLAPGDLDLVLVPLVVFDADCNRIGMGGGYYDRSFAFRKDPAQRKPALIGVAHEMQKVERIEPEAWDVRLDKIVTDETVYRP
ncbi:MAG TPA: 5-formyltetrahydrofolate cyclo-ligase [Gammaproteobacteria bacterium]|nr:5-formyltetrahydrofolate cyclo-ligase [Gammaproteobacteria bacterium]